jgi:lysophospholipase L1-like esterase
MLKPLRSLTALLALGLASHALANPPADMADNTRYLAMGDSLTAGWGAMPATEGYAYVLYQQGAYDNMPDTTFANAAMPGATSQHVLAYQVPLATQSGFDPHVITMTVGGNDLLAILGGADPAGVLTAFQGNLYSILAQLCAALPHTRIYVANLYVIEEFPVPTAPAVLAFNQVVDGVTAFANAVACAGRARVADVHAAFSGPQGGLLLVNRNGAGQFEVHPTNEGYRAMARAFVQAR